MPPSKYRERKPIKVRAPAHGHCSAYRLAVIPVIRDLMPNLSGFGPEPGSARDPGAAATAGKFTIAAAEAKTLDQVTPRRGVQMLRAVVMGTVSARLACRAAILI
jgi:hypothetical protein